MSRICDRRPCSGLAKIFPLLQFKMLGELNDDLKAVLSASDPEAINSQSMAGGQLCPVVLHYCPFCGMRLEEEVIEYMQRAKGAPV